MILTHYDSYSRPIQVQADNAAGGSTSTSSRYDFAGRVLKTLTTHSVPATDAITLCNRSVYDQVGCLKE